MRPRRVRTRPPHGLIIDVPQSCFQLRVMAGAHLDSAVMWRVDVMPVYAAMTAAHPLTKEQGDDAELAWEFSEFLGVVRAAFHVASLSA